MTVSDRPGPLGRQLRDHVQGPGVAAAVLGLGGAQCPEQPVDPGLLAVQHRCGHVLILVTGTDNFGPFGT
ncbi:MAG: hypothetical protein ACRDTC_03935 [Pseudonocardiaceae bacterium]